MKLIPRIKQRIYLFSKDWIVYLYGYDNYSKLNLGSAKVRFKDLLSSDISNRSTLRHDARMPFPLKDSSFDIVWSERMLEHLSVQDIYKVTQNVSKILKPGGRFRLCMPCCFYIDDDSINMMREGNYEKQLSLGHITWFTYEGIGPVSKSLFGNKNSPSPQITLHELFAKNDMNLKLIRWFDKKNKLYFDRKKLVSPYANTFLDEPDITIRRSNSLIFEGIKNTVSIY